ncbi:hypothetical protein ZIOFF_009478 [Zingiber officinale]|uniref:Uncharacterized protein n=1 Tax=Zingiber officinale TaxID=94328 RepID=A0A8J5HFM4_ZINOF|nr:hypothetical protein ZIOFF_009478 [Zingiber officinale]
MKKTKSNKASSQELQNGHTPSSKFLKLLDPQASWDKDNLGDTLHWIRQGLGLSCGLLCGAVPLIGAFWIVAFMVLSTSIIYGYYTYVLKLDEEDFGGHGALLQEGLFASFSLFLRNNSILTNAIMFLPDTAFVDCHIQFITLLKTVITFEFLSEIQMQPVEFNAHQFGVEWIGIC